MAKPYSKKTVKRALDNLIDDNALDLVKLAAWRGYEQLERTVDWQHKGEIKLTYKVKLERVK